MSDSVTAPHSLAELSSTTGEEDKHRGYDSGSETLEESLPTSEIDASVATDSEMIIIDPSKEDMLFLFQFMKDSKLDTTQIEEYFDEEGSRGPPKRTQHISLTPKQYKDYRKAKEDRITQQLAYNALTSAQRIALTYQAQHSSTASSSSPHSSQEQHRPQHRPRGSSTRDAEADLSEESPTSLEQPLATLSITSDSGVSGLSSPKE